MEIDREIDWKITWKRRCYASRSNPWGAVWGGVNPPVGEIWKRGTYQILFSKSLQPRGPAGFFSIGKHRQSQKHTHTNTRTRAHAHACGHAHAHAHAHAHTDTHARADALEQGQAPRPPPSCFFGFQLRTGAVVRSPVVAVVLAPFRNHEIHFAVAVGGLAAVDKTGGQGWATRPCSPDALAAEE